MTNFHSAAVLPPPAPMQSTQYGYVQRPPPPMAPPMPMYDIIHVYHFGLFVGLLPMLLPQPLLHSRLQIRQHINLVVEKQLLHYMQIVSGLQ